MLQELRRKLKQNEANAAQLQRWQGEYKRMVERYRQKETEVQQLTLTLKQSGFDIRKK